MEFCRESKELFHDPEFGINFAINIFYEHFSREVHKAMEEVNFLMEANETKVIAVCGKGGVGKTSISALITRALLADGNHRILAIDADPAVGFATALGVQVGRTVDDIRNEVIATSLGGLREDKLAILSRLDYEVFEAMIEKDQFAFLAIGRPETRGLLLQGKQLSEADY